MTDDLAERLRTERPADAARIIDALDATLDRAEWSVVAHESYVGAMDEVKAAATRYFIRAARLYTQFLSPTFHMIPWDSSQLLPEEQFNAVFEKVATATDSFQRISRTSVRELLADHPFVTCNLPNDRRAIAKPDQLSPAEALRYIHFRGRSQDP